MNVKDYIPKPLRNLLKKLVFAYRSWLIRKQGLLALKEIFDIINRDKPKAFAAFGTLLGLYRERALLGHNIDMDIGCFYEDFALDYIEIDGYHFCVPQHPEKFLLGRYGKNYMTPDKSYDYKNPAPCIRNTDRVAKMHRP